MVSEAAHLALGEGRPVEGASVALGDALAARPTAGVEAALDWVDIVSADSVGMRMLAQKFKTHFTFEAILAKGGSQGHKPFPPQARRR